MPVSVDGAGSFAQIANDASVPPGIFKSGFNPLYRVTPGTNAILGADGTQGITAEGPTLDYLLAPDPATGNLVDAAGNPLNPQSLTNYQRQITIVPATDASGNPNTSLSIITVTVRNNSGKTPRDYSIVGYMSKYK